jgi:hypothetical protein
LCLHYEVQEIKFDHYQKKALGFLKVENVNKELEIIIVSKRHMMSKKKKHCYKKIVLRVEKNSYQMYLTFVTPKQRR